MKGLKILFVGSIILLLIPVLNAVDINKNTSIQRTANINQNNSLGILNVTHEIFLVNRGAMITYTQPKNTTYYFKEINGTVLMNFTLIVNHQIVQLGFPMLIKPRYTLMDRLIIGFDETQLFNVYDSRKCESNVFVTYTIDLTEDMQMQPLKTNGENKALYFTLRAGVGAGIPINLRDGSQWYIGRFFSSRLPKGLPIICITIIPIPER